MTRIDIAAPEVALRSSLIFGASRAGKTWLNATWPRPAWFGSTREEGYETLRYMEPSAWYEPDVPPLLFGVSSIQELVTHLRGEVVPLIQKGRVRTVVVELSFYSDDIIMSLTQVDEKNGWVKYKALEDHFRWLDMFVKQQKVLLAYNALAAPVDEMAKAPAGILIAGKATSKKLPATVPFCGYLRVEEHGGKTDRLLHLGAYGPYTPGHRYGDRLPQVVRNPTYRKLEDLLIKRATVDRDGNVVYGDSDSDGKARGRQQLPPL